MKSTVWYTTACTFNSLGNVENGEIFLNLVGIRYNYSGSDPTSTIGLVKTTKSGSTTLLYLIVNNFRSVQELAHIEFKPEIGTWPWAPVVQKNISVPEVRNRVQP
jgi:hypothetical protein